MIRKQREIERLIHRTGLLSDGKQVKENIQHIELKIQELRSEFVINQKLDDEFRSKISQILSKNKEHSEKENKRKNNASMDGEMEKREKMNQELLKEDLLKLSTELKEEVHNINTKHSLDDEVLNTVVKGVEEMTKKSENLNANLDKISSQRLGFKAYIQFACVVVAYIIISFFFK